GKTKPRRRQSETILSIVTASVSMAPTLSGVRLTATGLPTSIERTNGPPDASLGEVLGRGQQGLRGGRPARRAARAPRLRGGRDARARGRDRAEPRALPRGGHAPRPGRAGRAHATSPWAARRRGVSERGDRERRSGAAPVPGRDL